MQLTMMKKTMNKLPSELNVWLHDELIGTLFRAAGDKHFFLWDKEYVNNDGRNTLSLSFKDAEGKLFNNIKPIQNRLPPFFSNLLPEGELRNYLAKQLGISTKREFFLLNELGADLPGAIRITSSEIKSAHFIEEENSQSKNLHDALLLHFSLAGVQLKFSAIAEKNDKLTIPVNGIGGSWIVKLPSLRFPYIPENEFVMLSLARAIGIPVPTIRLVPVKEIQGLPSEISILEGNALVIERFDRGANNTRIHMEDFAQVFGLFPERKYEKRHYANIAQVLSAETSEKDVTDFIRRLIFSVLIGNGDMHLKNWSLLYRDGIRPELSPAYDFVSTIPYLPKDQLALNFGDSKDLTKLTADQIRRFSLKAQLPTHFVQQLAKETIEMTLEAWQQSSEKSILSSQIQEAIDTQLNKVALFSTHDRSIGSI